jgi:hypothetical protein
MKVFGLTLMLKRKEERKHPMATQKHSKLLKKQEML